MTTENPSPENPQETKRRRFPFLRTLDSLAIPAYRNYFGGMFFYFGAMQMTVLARPWLAFALSENDAGERSVMALGVTVAANHVPSLILSPWAGALADRMSKRNILIIAAFVMAAFALLIAGGLIADILSWWHIAIIGVGQGAVMTFITPTRRAIVADLVDREYLLNATALHTVSQNLNRTIMPLMAGALIEFVGAEWAYVAIAGLYGGGILGLLTVPITTRAAPRRQRGMTGAVGDGFKYVAKEPVIRNLLLIGLVGSIFGQPIQQLLPMFQGVLDIGETQLGMLFTAMGIGSLLGSTTAASLGDFKRKGLLLIGFFTLLAAAIVAFSASSIFLLSLILMVPVGFGHSGRTAVHLATLQAYSDPEMRGRVMALNAMQGGFMPLSILGITALAEVSSPQIAMGVSGGVMLVYGIWEMLLSKTVRRLE